MGREDPTGRAEGIRDRISRESRIEIRTYDRLIRAAEGLAHLGLLDLETEDPDLSAWFDW
ncbi:hypothetical protein ACWGF3_11775 [Streptomyces xanthophaeus]|nr:hypothetical protein [Streptomyces xanthophaeus]